MRILILLCSLSVLYSSILSTESYYDTLTAISETKKNAWLEGKTQEDSEINQGTNNSAMEMLSGDYIFEENIGEEVGTEETDILNGTSHVKEVKMDIGKIEMLELNKQYSLKSTEKMCLLEIRHDQFSVVEIIINEKSNKIESYFDRIETVICYANSNGEYRLGLCGKSANDYKSIEIYKITETGMEKENEIIGEIESILANGEITVQSRQFLVGFQILTITYKISNDGQMMQEEEFKINNDTFTLVNSIKAKMYDSDISDYREIRIPEGEKLTFYKTNMQDKLYFKRDNGDEGYIEMIFIDTDEEFSVNGIELVNYFDGSELSWAG